MTEEYEMHLVPPNVRKRKAVLALIATLGVAGWMLWVVVSEYHLGWSTLGLLPFVVVGCWASYHYWTTTEVRKPKAATRPAPKAVESKLTPIDKAWQHGINIIGGLLVLSGLGIVGLQVFAYLKSGEWTPLPLKLLVALGPADLASWIQNPDSWRGLHKIVNGALELAPLSLCALALGVWMAGYKVKSDS